MHAVEYLLELKGYTLELFIPDSQPAFATGKIPTTRAPRINSLFFNKGGKTRLKKAFAAGK
jgi:hypothetical protein